MAGLSLTQREGTDRGESVTGKISGDFSTGNEGGVRKLGNWDWRGLVGEKQRSAISISTNGWRGSSEANWSTLQ